MNTQGMYGSLLARSPWASSWVLCVNHILSIISTWQFGSPSGIVYPPCNQTTDAIKNLLLVVPLYYYHCPCYHLHVRMFSMNVLVLSFLMVFISFITKASRTRIPPREDCHPCWCSDWMQLCYCYPLVALASWGSSSTWSLHCRNSVWHICSFWHCGGLCH